MLLHRGGFRHYNREILKFMENFLAHMTGEEGKIERDMDTNTEKNKETN